MNEDAYSDSLSQLLETADTDSLKTRLCFELSDYWSYKDTAISRRYLDSSRILAKGHSYLEALYPFYEAGFYFDSDPARSEAAYLRADSALMPFATRESYFFRAKAWRNYGALRQRRDDHMGYTEALLNKAIPLARQAGDITYEGICYQDLGLLFMNDLQYDKAAYYYRQSIALLKNTGSKYTALVTSYLLACRNEVFAERYDSAKLMLDKATAILAPYPESSSFLDAYLAEGIYYGKTGQFTKAENSLDKGIALATRLHDDYGLQEQVFQKYKLLKDQGKYAEGMTLLKTLLKSEKIMALANNRVILYYELADASALSGKKASAFDWLKMSMALKDSLANAHFKRDLNELETRYRKAEDLKKIAVLRAEKKQAALAASNNRLFNWLLGAACLILSMAVFFIIAYLRNQKKLAGQQDLNHQHQLKEIAQRNELTATRAMLDGEEQERKRMAHDLHDGLGGMLAGIKINLAGWAAAHPLPAGDRELEKVIGQVDQSLGELRRIARNLMPETLQKFGLETALKDLCEFYMNDQIHIEFQPFHIEKSLDLPVQIQIYRIVQEILSNAIRHAGAGNIVLQCSQSEQTFFITLEDDGQGFDMASVPEDKGMGLGSLKNRVEYLKGNMEILSAPGTGTTINIELHVDN